MILVPSVLVFLALEDTPAVGKTGLVDTDKATRAKHFTARTLKKLLSHDDAVIISVSASEEDLNSLMAVAASGLDRLEGRLRIAPEGLHADLTVRLPRNPAGDFLNLRFRVLPSASGFHISPVAVGRINIPGKTALSLIRFVLDMVLGNENGAVALGAVHSVVLRDDSVIFNLWKIPDIRERKELIVQRFKFLRDAMPLVAEPETVRDYYVKLMELGHRVETGRQVSLAYFIGPLFELARERSTHGDPAEENKAALLALAIFTGDARFEQLIGEVRTETMKLYRPGYRRVLLGGREDLKLHFVISAGLKIVADSGLTYAVGEFKELLDARRGGSGFSFADLAADMAGTRLAEEAADPSGGAGRIQSALAGEAREGIFFPEVSDLPEDISQQEFELAYGNVENPGYLSLVEKIKSRISRLPVYSGG